MQVSLRKTASDKHLNDSESKYQHGLSRYSRRCSVPEAQGYSIGESLS